MDVKEFRKRGKELIHFIADYHANLSDRPIPPAVEPGFLLDLLPENPPEKGEKWEKIIKDTKKHIFPGITHWVHPRFHAYFPVGCSYPSLLGALLTNALRGDGFTRSTSPACPELERIAMDWFGKMLGLPDKFLFYAEASHGCGVVKNTVSECTLQAMLAARRAAIKDILEVDPYRIIDLPSHLVAYGSQETHSSAEKAAKICMVKFQMLNTDSKQRLRGNVLKEAIEKDKAMGFFPFFVVATLGTTSSAACDKLNEIGPLCKSNGLWLHVDAAYAGNAFVCEEFRSLANGIEFANTVTVNPCKWMLITFYCATMWVDDRDKFAEYTADVSFSTIDDPVVVASDYRLWGVPVGQEFSSVKLWFTIRKYGLKNLREYIRNHVRLAKVFEAMVRKDERFEIKNEVRLSLVCFRMKGTNELNERLNRSINTSGKIHVVPAHLGNEFVIRFCVCHEHATEEDIAYAWNVIRKHAGKLEEHASIRDELRVETTTI